MALELSPWLFAAHPDVYLPGVGWQDDVVRSLEGIVPQAVRGLLDKLPTPDGEMQAPSPEGGEREGVEGDPRRLGW
jgi:hypothetical protein